MTLDLGQQGKKVTKVCEAMDVSRATYYRWKSDGDRPREKPGRKGPDPVLLRAMREEIRTLRHVKRRTWGTQLIYDTYGGLIPREVIRKTISEERTNVNRDKRRGWLRYEFVAPDVAWSADFMYVKPSGKVLRLQDERSRCVIGYEFRDMWTQDEVARFTSSAFARHGAPLFFKHDLEGLFSEGIFQAMLRGSRVIPLPNPPYYPQANGKQERLNSSVRQWLLPLTAELPTREEVLKEMTGAMSDLNSARRKDVLEGRTPLSVYTREERVAVKRARIYERWSVLRDNLLRPRPVSDGVIEPVGEMESARLAALSVLREYKLVRYSKGGEAPKV